MNNIEFNNMVLGTNIKEESITEQPIWEVRCWLESLNEGEYVEVTMNDIKYKDGRSDTLIGIKEHRENSNIEESEELFDIFNKEDVLKYCKRNNINPEIWENTFNENIKVLGLYKK